MITADSLLDSLPWGVLVLDEQRRVRRLNQQAARWCDAPAAVLLGRALAEAALPPTLRATLLQLLEPAAATPHEVWIPRHEQWVAFTATSQPGGWVLYGQDITQQKLREQQYQALAENTPDVLTRWTPDLRLAYANSAFAAKAEQPMRALLGRTFGEMDVPAEVTDPYMTVLQQVFDTGQPQEHYNVFPTPQGPVQYHSRLVPELRDGEIETVLGIARDITELQQTQAEALRLRDELTQRATDKYHALFRSMNQGFCVLEVLFDETGEQAVDYRYLEMNPVFAQQLGMPDDAVGKTIRELMPDLEAFWFDTFGQVARTGAAVRVEHAVPQLDRWFEVHAFALDAPAGRQVAVLFTDVTARRQAEQAIRESEEKYRMLFETTLQGFGVAEILVDEAGTPTDYRMLEINPQFERLTGQRRAVFLDGRTVREIAPELEEEWYAFYGQVGLSGVPAHREIHAEGWHRWFEVSAYRTGWPEQHRVGIFFTDITERKQNEQRQQFLLQLSDALRPLTDPVAMQRAALDVLRAHLGGSRTLYAEALDQQGTMRITAECRAAGLVPMEGQVLRFQDFGETLAGQPLWREDVNSDEHTPAQQAGYAALGTRAWLMTPLVKDGHLVAELTVHSATAREWTAADIALVRETTERTWAAVARARAEEALRVSEEQFRTVANLVPDLLWRSTPASDTTWYNQRWYEYTGQTPEDATDYGWTSVIHPDDRAESSRRYHQAITDGQLLRQEHRIRSAQGEYRWFQVQAQPVRDAHGTVSAWFGAATDIHERKLAEQHQTFLLQLSDALRAETNPAAVGQRATQLLAEQLGADRVYLVALSADDDTVTVTHEARRADLPPLQGTYRSSDFPAAIQEIFTHTIVYDDVRTDARLTELDRRSFAGLGAVGFIAAPIRRGSEAMIWAAGALSTQPRAWTAIEIALFEAAIERIWTAVERAHAEEILQASEAKYRRLFETMSQGYNESEVVRDAAGRAIDYRFCTLNPAFERLTGIPVAVALGRTARELTPTLEDEWIAAVDRVVQSGDPLRMEYQAAALGRWFALHLYPTGGDRFIGLYDDITERKRHEENLAFLAEVSDDLLEMRRIEEAVALLGKKIGRKFGVVSCNFAEMSEDAETVVVTAWNAEGVASVTGVHKLEDIWTDERRARHRRGEVTVVNDTQADPRVKAAGLAAIKVRSYISVPLARDGAFKFLLAITDSEPREWRADEIKLAQELTTRIWMRLERVRAEEALRISEEKYRRIFENIDQGFSLHELLVDESGQVTDLIFREANEAFAQHTGLKDVQGKKASEVVPKLEQGWLDAMTRAYKSGESQHIEAYNADTDRWITSQYSRIGGAGSRLLSTLFTDITERKQQEQQQEFRLKLSDLLRLPLAAGGEMQQAAMRLLAEYFQVLRAVYYEAEPDEDTFTLTASFAQHPVPLPPQLRLSDFSPTVADEYRTGRTQRVADTENEPTAAAYRAIGVRAWLAVPFVSHGRLATVVGLHAATPRAWTAADAQVLEYFAERLYAAVEKAKAEEALRASEANYAALFASSPVPFMVLAPNKPDFTIIAANDAYFATTYSTPADLLGRRMLDVFTIDPTQPGRSGSGAVASSVARVLATKQTDVMPRIRYDLVLPSGELEPRWWLAVNAPLLDTAGQVSAIIHQATNVTELYYAEVAEQERQQRQAFLLQLSDALRAEPDADAVANRALQLLSEQLSLDRCYIAEWRTEVDHGDFTHQVGNDKVLPLPESGIRISDFPEAVRIATDRTLVIDDFANTKGLSDIDRQNIGALGLCALLAATLRKGENNPLWVIGAVSATPRHWTLGEIALLEEATERTWAALERARAEEARRESERRRRSMADTAPALIWETDPSGVVFLNQYYLDFFGVPLEEVRGMGWAQFLHPDDAEAYLAVYQRAAVQREPYSHECRFLRADGQYRWLLNTARPFGDENIVGFSADITDNKLAEAVLRASEERQAFLLQLSDALRPAADSAAMERTAMQVLGETLRADRVFLAAINADGASWSVREEYTAGLPSGTGSYPMSEFQLKRLPQWQAGQLSSVADSEADPTFSAADRAAYVAFGIRAAIGVPLVKGGRFAALLCVNQATPRLWTAAELALTSEAAERIWVALARARAEEALRASEARLAAAFESVPVGIAVIDRAGAVSLANAEFHRFVPGGRLPSRDAAALARWRAWDAHGRPLEPQEFPGARALRGEIVMPGQEMLYTDDAGQEIWTIITNAPIRDEAGRITGLVSVINNVDATKRSAEALRASEQRQRALIENLPGAAVFVVGPDLRYQLAEGEALRPVGHEPADFLGRTVQEMVPPEQWPTYRATYQGALAGQPFEHEHEQDGRLFLTRGVPLVGPAGEVSAVLAVSYDLTDRRRAEEALRLSEAKYRTLFESMDQGFAIAEVLLDEGPARVPDLRWLEMNPQFEYLTGLPHAALMEGQTLRQLLPTLDEEWLTRYARVVTTGEPVSFEQYVPELNRWFDVSTFAIGAPSARRIAVLFNNTTERKRMEEALRHTEERHREQLEQQVARRTRQLQESRDLLQSVLDSGLVAVAVFRTVRTAAGAVDDFTFMLVNKAQERMSGRTDLVGQHYAQVYPGIRKSGIWEQLLHVVATGQPQQAELYYPYDNLNRWYEYQFVQLGDGVVATTLDVTARKQAEAERLRNLHLLEQAEAVAGLGSWDYDLLTGEFLWSDGMYQLFGLPLGEPVRPEVYLHFVVAEDQPQAERLLARITAGTDSFEETLRLRVGEQVKTVRIKAVVLYNEAGQAVRVLGVDLDISELQRLEADNLRLRLTQQQALFEAVQAAQEEERKRMAESLHNGIGQILYATKLRLDRLPASSLDPDPALEAARREANHLLSEAIGQTRALSHELVPLVLEEFGLPAALQDIGRNMSTPQLRLRSHVALDEAVAPLTPALQMALYRMAQELAQNIVKHARGATQASLELETMPGWVLLRAEDNGPGFAATLIKSPGLGLRSIRDRVALLGGQLETGSLPAGGAYVRIRIPLPIS